VPFHISVLFIWFLFWFCCLVHLFFTLALVFCSFAFCFGFWLPQCYLKVFISSCINSLKWILALAFDFLSGTWEFLQVLASIHSSGFYLWLLTSLVLLLESFYKFLHQFTQVDSTFGFQHRWCCLRVLASSYINSFTCGFCF
jgi:hypothetical protein